MLSAHLLKDLERLAFYECLVSRLAEAFDLRSARSYITGLARTSRDMIYHKMYDALQISKTKLFVHLEEPNE